MMWCRRSKWEGAAWPRLAEWLSSGHLVGGSALEVAARNQRSSSNLQGFGTYYAGPFFGHVRNGGLVLKNIANQIERPPFSHISQHNPKSICETPNIVSWPECQSGGKR